MRFPLGLTAGLLVGVFTASVPAGAEAHPPSVSRYPCAEDGVRWDLYTTPLSPNGYFGSRSTSRYRGPDGARFWPIFRSHRTPPPEPCDPLVAPSASSW